MTVELKNRLKDPTTNAPYDRARTKAHTQIQDNNPSGTTQQNTTALTPATKNQNPSSKPSHDSDATDATGDVVDSTTNDQNESPHPPTTDATEDLEPWVDWIKRCTHAKTEFGRLRDDAKTSKVESC